MIRENLIQSGGGKHPLQDTASGNTNRSFLNEIVKTGRERNPCLQFSEILRLPMSLICITQPYTLKALPLMPIPVLTARDGTWGIIGRRDGV